MKNLRYILLALTILVIGSLAYSDGLMPYATVKIDQTSTNSTVKLSSSGNTVKMDGTTNTVKIDGTTNTVQAQRATYATYSALYTVATTTAGGVAVSPLTGRDKIIFRVASTTPAVGVTVSLGTTTANVGASSSIVVMSGDPVELELPATVPMGYIASSAVDFTILQLAY
jgi:hypothetical protein